MRRARLEGTPPPKRGEELVTHDQYVTPTVLQTIGVGLVQGRWLSESDRDSLNPVCW